MKNKCLANCTIAMALYKTEFQDQKESRAGQVLAFFSDSSSSSFEPLMVTLAPLGKMLEHSQELIPHQNKLQLDRLKLDYQIITSIEGDNLSGQMWENTYQISSTYKLKMSNDFLVLPYQLSTFCSSLTLVSHCSHRFYVFVSLSML